MVFVSTDINNKKNVTCTGYSSTERAMGKSKTNKFKRPRINAIGLPANAVQELNVEEEPNGEESCPAGELLEKVGMSSNNAFCVC